MLQTKTSPFAPSSFPAMPSLEGVRMASCHAGFKKKERLDLTLFEFCEGTHVAGIFTNSKCPSAAVTWCRHALKTQKIRALCVNSGNANAFTGEAGRQSTLSTLDYLHQLLSVPQEHIFIASTGVIGELLSAVRINQHLEQLHGSCHSDGWRDSAHAIMTTDAFAKGATRSFNLDGKEVHINGIAKGAGMIAPDMATMLCFICSNVVITPALLQQALRDNAAATFNAITVDSDTSTSDTVLLTANGKAGHTPLTSSASPAYEKFVKNLHEVMQELALYIVGDGEGAQKRIKITVEGAEHDEAARIIAFSIANSPLVKTAMAGEDPNWGRIVMAVGKAGQMATPDTLSIRLCDITVTDKGEAQHYNQEELKRAMKNKELTIHVHLNIKQGASTVWTSDLNHDYITLNADYRS